MTRPQQYTQNTDFDAMKNDDTVSISFQIVSGTSIAAGGAYTPEAFADVGQKNATIRAHGMSSRYADRWTVGTIYNTLVESTLPSIPITYDENIQCYVERVSATRIRAWCTIVNLNGVTQVISGATQTITFEVRTFVSPFEALT